jgi:V/A-type H+-transporting ATPase subunit F
MKIAAIGDEESMAALKLIGIKSSYSDKEKFDELVADNDVGIILISEAIAAELSAKIMELRMNRLYPIIVEIPDKTGSQKRKDPVEELIKRAVGVELGKEQ